MILLKFVFWIIFAWLCLFLFFRIFGPMITKYLLRYFIKKAQQDMDRQSQVYQQYAEGHSPFEDSVYVNDETRVSMRRGQKAEAKRNKGIDDSMIEEVDFEDID